MARNILEGRDANDGIEPLPVPQDRQPIDLGPLQWAMDQLNKDHELVPFIRNLPDFVMSSGVDGWQRRLLSLFDNGIGDPIFKTLRSCNDGVFDVSQQQGCLVCMDFVWLSARWFAACRFSSELIDLLVDLTATAPPIATYARCTIVILTWEALSAVISRPSLPAHWEQELATVARGRLLMGLHIMLPLRPLLSSLTGNGPSLSYDRGNQTLRWIRPHLREVRLVLLVQVVLYYLNNPSDTVLRALFNILKQWIDESPPDSVAQQPQSLQLLLVELEIALSHDPQQIPNFPQNVRDIVRPIVETLRIPTWMAMARNILEGRGLNVGIAPLPVPQDTQPTPRSSMFLSQPDLNGASETTPASRNSPAEA